MAAISPLPNFPAVTLQGPIPQGSPAGRAPHRAKLRGLLPLYGLHTAIAPLLSLQSQVWSTTDSVASVPPSSSSSTAILEAGYLRAWSELGCCRASLEGGVSLHTACAVFASCHQSQCRAVGNPVLAPEHAARAAVTQNEQG